MIKLTAGDVLKIKADLESGKRNVDIAREFGIHPSTVAHIKRGFLWGAVNA